MRSFAFLTLLLAQAATNVASPVSSASMSMVGQPILATAAPTAGSKVIRDSSALDVDEEAAKLFKRASYSQTGLTYHNAHRKNHSASAVTWNTNLASYAASVAASCTFAHNLTAGGGGYGQNLAAYGGSGDIKSLGSSLMLARAITMQWYNGEYAAFLPSYYGEATPDINTFSDWGHFTQVLWKGTTQVGCATQYCAADTIFPGVPSWYTVCDYSSAGNYIGQFGTNVGKPVGGGAVLTV